LIANNAKDLAKGGENEGIVDVTEHFRLTGRALKNWFIAQVQDSLAVALLWLVGLWVLKVPWAPLWALLAAIFQFVPHLGPVLGLLGPVLAATLRWTDWEHPLYVLMLYAVIAVVDGFLLQPYLMKRTAKVPIWASILTPIVLGILIPFWGVLLAAPLLAIIFAYKARREKNLSVAGAESP
jgi:predicted PurR-regulated permease PerM